MIQLKTIDDLGDLSGKVALLRADLNVPMDGDRVTDSTRLRRLAPTVRALAKKKAVVVLISHMGRPKGKKDSALSLKKLVSPLEKVLGRPVRFAGEPLAGATAKKIKSSKDSVLLLENLRFHKEEEKNGKTFAKKLAALGDVYVNDAFSCSHRAHASIEGITHFLPSAAGPGLLKEIEALTRALEKPKRPVTAVIGGAKISTKIDVLENLITKMDHIIIGGAMANTFLAGLGKNVGKSLYEKELTETAAKILEKAKKKKCVIHLPKEVTVAKELKEKRRAKPIALPLGALEKDDMILDIGPKAADDFLKIIRKSKTVLWNGPMGAFEVKPYDAGTIKLARYAAKRTQSGKLLSIAGGGDTVAALSHARVKTKFSYISAAGGAFLEWLEGKTLPGIKALMV